MKIIYTACLILLSISISAQEAGRAGDLLKNEVKADEIQSQRGEKYGNRNVNYNPNSRNSSRNPSPKIRVNKNLRWNYNSGNSQVFLRIPENGRFTVEIGDQMMSNSSGKFRFFDFRAGKYPISIYENNFLIYRTWLNLNNNTRIVLDFFTDYGLYLLGNYPLRNESYGIIEWDDIWNNPYINQNGNWPGNNGSGGYYPNVMTQPEFNNLITTLERNTNFDEERIGIILSVARNSNFNSKQIHSLIKTMSFEKNKLQIAKQLYSKCVDPQNFHQVYEAFDFSSSKRELSDYISNMD